MEHLQQDGSHKGILMTLGTVLLYIFSKMTVQEWAGIAAIAAGLSTAAFNGYKFILLIKHNRKNKKN